MRRGLTALALLLALVAAAWPALGQKVPAQKKEDAMHAEQRRLRDAQKQLKEEREKAAEARRRETSILTELEDIDHRLAEKRREVTRLDGRIRQAQGDVQGLRKDIERLEGRRAGQEAALALRLRTIYKIHAQGGALPLMLSGDDPRERAITIRHLTSVAALDVRMIQEYRGVSEKLGDRKAREEARQTELSGLRADARREQGEVDREASRRRGLLARVREERVYHERMVGELSEATRRLEALIRDLAAKQRRLARVPPPHGVEPPGTGFGSLRGHLPWPAAGRIVAAFGARVNPRFGTRTFKNGVDIEAVEGTEVTAVYAGHVLYTGWFRGYGNLIILDHGNEYYTLYAHVAEIHVKEGDEVRQGQRIGSVGDTGSLEGPRLYFEVRYQSRPQDPAEWLRQRG